MRILIIKISALGDVVHSLPALAYIKEFHADAEIDWLVEEGLAPLLEGHPLLHRVHRLGFKRWRRQGFIVLLRGLLEMARTLRRQPYDVVLDLQGNCKSGLFTLLSKARLRYGFARHGVREWPNLLATNRKVVLGEADHHISDRSLAVAREAFPGAGKAPLAGPLHVDEGAADRVARQLHQVGFDDQPLLVLQYGTTWRTKLWSLDHWRELVRRLTLDNGLRPVLIWGNDEERQATELIAAASNGRAVIWPRASLHELVALLQRADLVVGGDTGPVHIAAALDRPTVSIFRVTDAKRNGPRGEKHICLQAPMPCGPCLKKSCPQDAECARSISVADVYGAVGRLLAAREA